MNLFLVTSPFQYICALEAKAYFKTKNNILFLVNQPQEPGLSQQNKLIDKNEWDHIVTTERSNRSINVPRAIRKIKKLAADKPLQHFFYAEYTGWRTKLILKNLRIEKEIYFDDGTLTLVDYEQYVKPKIPFHRPRLIQDRIVSLFGCRPIGYLEQSDRLEVFTIFELTDPVHKVHKNQLTELKKKYNFPCLYNENAPVGFIGQGAVGDKYQRSVQEYVSDLTGFIHSQNRPVIYFPHRTESETVRKAVSQIPRLEYHFSEYPLEIELVDKQIKLSALIGLRSTVHFTASLLYKDIKLYCISTTNESMASRRKERIKILQDALGRLGVETI